jgi:large subunit ribosomal protein L17
MRHRVAGRKFSRPTGHRDAMLHNLVTDLLRYEKITTTEAKAKAVRSLSEKVITLGKAGTLSARRQALTVIRDKKIVDKVFKELASRYAGREGGYTHILKLGYRMGDGAPMARIELVEVE